jgi:hypothetical protein
LQKTIALARAVWHAVADSPAMPRAETQADQPLCSSLEINAAGIRWAAMRWFYL